MYCGDVQPLGRTSPQYIYRSFAASEGRHDDLKRDMLYLDHHRGIAHYTLASWRVLFMPVSVTNSKLIYDALKACDVKIISALPETWLVHLIRMDDEDPNLILVRIAKE